MAGIESQNKWEQLNDKMSEIKDKAKQLGEKVGNTIDQKYTDIKEDRNSKRMLNDIKKDHEKRWVKINNETVANALKQPTKENVKSMQNVLGYNKEGKNFYNPIHLNDMKSSDGQAGPFTLAAINNMAVDWEGKQLQDMNIPKANISQTEWVKNFIGTLHPFFYNKFEKTTKLNGITNVKENENATKVTDTMTNIKEWTATKEQIQTMQVALHETNCYPTTHNKEQKDGIPGPFTQVALQNFVFKYIEAPTEKKSPETITSTELQNCCEEWNKWINIEKNNKTTDDYLNWKWYPGPHKSF